MSKESSSADDQIAGKRKRRQPGQWWMNSSEKTEETNVTERLPTVKKSKRKNTEPLNVAVPSPVKSKKDGDLEQQPGPSSSQKTNKAREKKTKQSKNRNQERKTPRKTKASQEVFVETEAEQIEQQEASDPLHSSPLVLPHRDHSSSSGKIIVKREKKKTHNR